MAVDGRRDGTVQDVQFLVDLDPERLEGALRGVASGLGGTGGHHRTDLFDEFPGSGEGLLGASRHNPVGDAAGKLFFSPFPDDPDEVLFAVVVDDVGGGLAAARVHPHIQRRVEGVGEAALPFVQLKGRDAKVHEHTVDFGESQVREDVRDFVVDGVNKVDPVREGRQPLPRQGQCFLVAVDADQVKVFKTLEEGLGVTAHAERGVDDHRGLAAAPGSVEARGQQIDAPVLEDRYMALGRRLRLVGIRHAFVLPLSSLLVAALTQRSLVQIPIRAYPAPAWLRGSEPGQQPDGRLEISIKERCVLCVSGDSENPRDGVVGFREGGFLFGQVLTPSLGVPDLCPGSCANDGEFPA